MSAQDKFRILVVEDTRDISDLLVIRLELGGYLTCVARNCEQAIAQTYTFKPNAILLDIGLGDGGDGFEVLRILKSGSKTCDIPVLMLTARQALTDIRRAIDMGARDYVTKPFDDRKLLMRVAKLLGQPMPRFTTERSML
jgi:DNA-binding response OmpR family regulator